MIKLTHFTRISALCWLILASGGLMSCTYQGLPDLALDQVSVAELPANAGSDKRLVLLVEISEIEPFPRRHELPYVRWGFCGEQPAYTRMALGTLYVKGLLGGVELHGDRPLQSGTHTAPPLFEAIDVKRPQGLANNPDFPDWDLRNDHRDVCLRAVVPSMFSVSRSNEVRIPRDTIARALREGMRRFPYLMR